MNTLIFIYPLVIILVVYLSFRYYLPSIVYKVSRKEINLISNIVRNSGRRIESLSCGGIVSGIHIGKGLLRLEVYEGGIWLKPVLVIPFGIERKNILNVHLNKKKNNFILIINHNSSVVFNPLEINLGYGDFSELAYYILGK